jgi:hypothetical protein
MNKGIASVNFHVDSLKKGSIEFWIKHAHIMMKFNSRDIRLLSNEYTGALPKGSEGKDSFVVVSGIRLVSSNCPR